MEKTILKVKAYNVNATVFDTEGEKAIDFRYDADYLACYGKDCYDTEEEAIAEWEADIKEEIMEAFPNADEDSIEDVIGTMRIYAACHIGSHWM